MPVAFVVEVPGVTAKEYERVTRKVNESGSPAGCIFHAGGAFDGGIRLTEVWESQQAAEAFYGSEMLRQATGFLPDAQQRQPKVLMTWPVHGIDDGTGWRAVD